MVKFNKGLNIVFFSTLLSILLILGYNIGSNININASVGIDDESMLLEKSKILSDIVEYQEGINQYFSTSKTTNLTNISISKLEKLKKEGYKIFITDEKNGTLPTPIKKIDKNIYVSIYSNSVEEVNFIKELE